MGIFQALGCRTLQARSLPRSCSGWMPRSRQSRCLQSILAGNDECGLRATEMQDRPDGRPLGGWSRVGAPHPIFQDTAVVIDPGKPVEIMVLCTGPVQSYQGLGLPIVVPWNLDAADVNSDPSLFLPHCVSVDLEVDPKTARLFAFAAVRGGGGEALAHKNGKLESGLDRLEAFCNDARHLIAHNILRHDLPHLVANRAQLAALGAAPIDTLWLNPLAFPRNPYHHLVKHYQDGRLQAGHVNDPELDARLVLQVLADQIAAFGIRHSASLSLRCRMPCWRIIT